MQLSLWDDCYEDRLRVWSDRLRLDKAIKLLAAEHYAKLAKLEHRKYALYRHFDVNGRLLYVGISCDPDRRILQHKAASHWYSAIQSISIEWVAGISKAKFCELAAILAEKPLYNRAGINKENAQPALPLKGKGK